MASLNAPLARHPATLHCSPGRSCRGGFYQVHLRQQRRFLTLPREGPRCASSSDSQWQPQNSADVNAEGNRLAGEFMKFVAETAQDWPATNPKPTALLPPTAVVKAQMDALMRNDWPESDNGVRTAFKFAMPEQANELIPGSFVVRAARTWEAAEKYLTHAQFEELLKDPAYAPVVNCASWEFCSPLTFHRRGDEHALQAVKVQYTPPNEVGSAQKEKTYTFILEKVLKGPYKGCWMVIGVRLGDYANV